jgi:hypothetical protein
VQKKVRSVCFWGKNSTHKSIDRVRLDSTNSSCRWARHPNGSFSNAFGRSIEGVSLANDHHYVISSFSLPSHCEPHSLFFDCHVLDSARLERTRTSPVARDLGRNCSAYFSKATIAPNKRACQQCGIKPQWRCATQRGSTVFCEAVIFFCSVPRFFRSDSSRSFARFENVA